MRHTEYAYASKVVFTKLTPQALIEAADSVVRVGSALAIGDTVEEMAVVRTLLPHSFHLCAAWLEVSKILLSQPRLFVHLYVRSAERRRLGVVRR